MGSDDLDNVAVAVTANAVAPATRVVLRAGEHEAIAETRSLLPLGTTRDVTALGATYVVGDSWARLRQPWSCTTTRPTSTSWAGLRLLADLATRAVHTRGALLPGTGPGHSPPQLEPGSLATRR